MSTTDAGQLSVQLTQTEPEQGEEKLVAHDRSGASDASIAGASEPIDTPGAATALPCSAQGGTMHRGGVVSTPDQVAFLSRVVPWPAVDGPGYINIHWTRPNQKNPDEPIWTGRACRTINEFQSNVAWGLTQPSILDIYFCLSMQAKASTNAKGTLVPRRHQPDAMLLKAIWLDVDVKDPPRGYATLQEARDAIDAFVAHVNMPEPSAIVGSGGGLHVYWISDKPLSPAEWSPFADGLKNAASDFGLRCDLGVTGDRARILRVPGTFNCKKAPRRPVTLLSLLPQDYDFARDLKHLTVHAVDRPKTLRHSDPSTRFDLSKFVNTVPVFPLDPNDRLSAGIEHSVLSVDWAPLAHDCSFIREALLTGGKEYSQPMWNLTTLVATFLEQGEKLAHKMGNKHPGYTPESTAQLWKRKLREREQNNLGWPSCNAIHASGCAACASCPHFQKGKSPLHLAGDNPIARQAPSTESSVVLWAPSDLKVSFSRIPHRRWLYGTLLVRGELTVVAAPGGAGKTALATGLGIEIATGRALLGEKVWPTAEQTVLYINGEDSSTEINRRLLAFAQAHGLSEQDLGRLHIAGADHPRTQSLSFLQAAAGSTQLDQAGLASLEAALQALKPDLLVLDPLVVFCGGGNMNDNAVMALMVRKLKALAIRYDCAMLIVHHTRKGRTFDDGTGDAERISGASAIVNLARRAVMPTPMTEADAKRYLISPSERFRFFKLLDAKSNLAPLSAEPAWYELESVELPNPELPTYPNGDRVQAVRRANLSRINSKAPSTLEDELIKYELMKLIDTGLIINGHPVPYSPNSTGNNKQRAVLTPGMEAVERAMPDRKWLGGDLRATVELALEGIKKDGWVVVEHIEKGQFRRCQGLRPRWERTPWATERENLKNFGGPTIRTPEEQRELEKTETDDLIRDVGGEWVNEVVNE